MAYRLGMAADGIGPLSGLEVLRATGWKDFEACPKTWALKFLGPDAGKDDTKAGSASDIGTAAHSIVEHSLRIVYGIESVPEEGSPAEAEVQAALWKKIPAEECEYLADYLSVVTSTEIVELLGDGIEHEFRITLEGIDVPLKGTMDLVGLTEDGAILVLDHKTNRGYDGKDYWSAELQPLIYAWAARKLWPGREVRYRIGYVNIGVPVDWVTDPAQDAPLEARLRANYARMRHYDAAGDWPTVVNDRCKWCPDSKTCPEHRAAIDNFRSSLLSRLSTTTPTERLAFVTAVKKSAEAEEAALKAQIALDVKAAGGRLVQSGVEWYEKTTESDRKIPAGPAVSAIGRWASGRPTIEAIDLESMLTELMTAKVGAADKIAKRYPELGKALADLVYREGSKTTLTARPLKPEELANGVSAHGADLTKLDLSRS